MPESKVKVDGEEAILHITDQSVMFETGGKVTGFERSAIRMVKPDGDAMIIAYSAGSKVESIRVEPMAAASSLLVSGPSPATVQAPVAGLDDALQRLYLDARKELEERLDSTESFVPLSITGKWKRTKLPRKVSLYVDGVPRAGAEALATPVGESESGYTIVFLPTATDIGVRELEVRIEGEEKPIYSKKVEVKVKGARSLEMKKVS